MLTNKFIGKWMRLAKQIGIDNNPCYSRQIGAIIIAPISNRILGTGYNGPPPGTPHTDTLDYLRDFFWPQLSIGELESLKMILLTIPELRSIKFKNENDLSDENIIFLRDRFLEKYVGKGICPRRIIGAKSGERCELCSCGHAERHAITNSCQCLQGSYMFCWCGVPCLQCTDSIIQSGIKRVYCLKEKIDYHPLARLLFKWGKVEIIELDRGEIE